MDARDLEIVHILLSGVLLQRAHGALVGKGVDSTFSLETIRSCSWPSFDVPNFLLRLLRWRALSIASYQDRSRSNQLFVNLCVGTSIAAARQPDCSQFNGDLMGFIKDGPNSKGGHPSPFQFHCLFLLRGNLGFKLGLVPYWLYRGKQLSDVECICRSLQQTAILIIFLV